MNCLKPQVSVSRKQRFRSEYEEEPKSNTTLFDFGSIPLMMWFLLLQRLSNNTDLVSKQSSRQSKEIREHDTAESQMASLFSESKVFTSSGDQIGDVTRVWKAWKICIGQRRCFKPQTEGYATNQLKTRLAARCMGTLCTTRWIVVKWSNSCPRGERIAHENWWCKTFNKIQTMITFCHWQATKSTE